MAKVLPKVEEIVSQIKEGYEPEKIILFGSHAKGKPHPYSDVDLLIIKKTREKFMERLKRVARLIKSDLGTDIIVYTPSEVKEILQDPGAFFSREVIQKGKVLYEKKGK